MTADLSRTIIRVGSLRLLMANAAPECRAWAGRSGAAGSAIFHGRLRLGCGGHDGGHGTPAKPDLIRPTRIKRTRLGYEIGLDRVSAGGVGGACSDPQSGALPSYATPRRGEFDASTRPRAATSGRPASLGEVGGAGGHDEDHTGGRDNDVFDEDGPGQLAVQV